MDLAAHALAERAIHQLVARHAAQARKRGATTRALEMHMVGRFHDHWRRQRRANQLSNLIRVHAGSGVVGRDWTRILAMTLPARYHAAPMSKVSASPLDDSALLATARRTLEIEQAGIAALSSRLDARVRRGLPRCCLACKGRVIVTGMGKSGHIAGKIAATLASTGTPAFFLHPAEASHGDLGMITRQDVLLAISNSGETAEIVCCCSRTSSASASPLIAMTGRIDSTLAQGRHHHTSTSASTQEACPHNLAPTASTTATLAMGDALAVAVLEARGFSAEDFARRHPGGSLGRRLLLHVEDIMRTGDRRAARATGHAPGRRAWWK